MDSKRLFFCKGDLLAAGLVVLLAIIVALCFLPWQTQTASAACIYQNGALVRTVSLEEDQQFTVIGDYTNIVTVKDGKIAITTSDCPGGDCVHIGFSDTPGRSIVCLPNAVEIRIVTGETDVDFVVG